MLAAAVRISRRSFLLSGLAITLTSNARTQPGHLKVVVAGGHPGDPECGCAGTIARYTALGHEVVLLYLNRGEGFCSGGKPDQCASIRTDEARNACRMLGARAVFASQLDGHAVVDDSHYQEFRRLLEVEKPDVVFAQWPIDRHRDHRALSQLALDAWLNGGRRWAFYYYEVADDTMMFTPSEYVDISSPTVEGVRRAACYAHASQQPDKWYPHQVQLTHLRGSESGHEQAEGFVRHWQSERILLP